MTDCLYGCIVNHLYHIACSNLTYGISVNDIVFWLKNNNKFYWQFPSYAKVPVHECKGKGKAVPLQTWGGPEGSRKLRLPDFMTTAHDVGKVVSLTHRPPLPPGNVPGTHVCYRLSRPQSHSAIGGILCQRKIPMSPAGIETATFRFVAQHLSHCATAVPPVPGTMT